VLFDSLADQCRLQSRSRSALPALLPTLPRALPTRVYSVPPPEPPLPPDASALPAERTGGGGDAPEEAPQYGPYECWPMMQRTRMHVPRPIPPLNFNQAPPTALPTAPAKAPPCFRAGSDTSVAAPSAPTAGGHATPGAGSSRPTHRRSASTPNVGPSSSTPSRWPWRRAGAGAASPRGAADANNTAVAHAAQSARSDRSGEPSTPPRPTVAREQGSQKSIFASLKKRSSTPLAPAPPPPPPPPLPPSEWARERLGEVFACALLCHALRVPHAPDPSLAVELALAELRSFAAMPSTCVVPPQCAYHALLRACSHCRLPELSRKLFAQLQAAGKRPDAQTIGWLSHALIEAAHSPPIRALAGHTEADGAEAGEAGEAGDVAADGAADTADASGAGGAAASAASTDVSDPMCSPGEGARGAAASDGGSCDHPAAVSARRSAWRYSMSFSTGTLHAASTPGGGAYLRSPESPRGGERVATLRIDATCTTCNAALGATDTTAGWFARHERDTTDDANYGCECPRCGANWQPTLLVSLVSTADLTFAAQSADATDGGADDVEDGAAESSTHGADTLTCPLLSPRQLLRELEALLESSRDRHTLREGWMRMRHLFPSVFWSLCWHAAPAGLLPRLLPHLELEPISSARGDAAKRVLATLAAAADMRGSALVLVHDAALPAQRQPSDERSGSGSGSGSGKLLKPSTMPSRRLSRTSEGSVESDGEGYAETDRCSVAEAPAEAVDFEGWVRGGRFVVPRVIYGS
jgi:hypothetical protein